MLKVSFSPRRLGLAMDRRIQFAFFTAVLAAGLPAPALPQNLAAPDEQILKAVGVKADNASLLQFLDRRSFTHRKLDMPAYREATACAARLLADRNAHAAIEPLLQVLPVANDTWLEGEILRSLGMVAINNGQPDAKLLAALKDPLPARRAAALYLLGRRASVAHRAVVRAYLADGDPLIRAAVAEGLLGKHVMQTALNSGLADDATFKANRVAATPASLLDFLRKRTPDAAAQKRIAGLVATLGAFDSADRAEATETLIKAGAPALAFLRPALASSDPEVARRARRCIEEIDRGSGQTLAAAVVRRLATPGGAEDVAAAVRVLLDFVPFADDELLEDEVLTSLQLLSVRQAKLDASLTEALGDSFPARRAAAAYVLASLGTAEQVEAVRKLLVDASPIVQLRSAQGLLAARDKAAVPKLIALYGEVQGVRVWQLEECLNRLATDQVPPDAAAAGATRESRRRAVPIWQKWWQQRQASVDLARAADGDAFLGLVTVCEYDNVALRFSGQVWEAPRNGSATLKIDNLVGPMDAQVLPNGRILVAENGASRVTERDRDGAVKWTCTIQGGNPICCQRLPNGNTFIALYNQLIEVRPDNSEVYRYSPGPHFYIFSARRTRSGTVVCVTAQGTLLEIDPRHGKTLRTIHLAQPAGGWASVEPLPNGNFLLATMSNSTVREVDPSGKDVWSFKTFQGVFRATQLPNGNILVASMNTREVAELDRQGTVRWKRTCQGRPWSIHYR
jgi:HEAT repeat protein